MERLEEWEEILSDEISDPDFEKAASVVYAKPLLEMVPEGKKSE